MDLSTIKDIERNMNFQRKSSKQILDLLEDLRKDKGVDMAGSEALERYCTDILAMADKAIDLVKVAEPYYKKEEKKPAKKAPAKKIESVFGDIVVDDDDMSFLE